MQRERRGGAGSRAVGWFGAVLLLAGCLPEGFGDFDGAPDPEPWGPPVACTDSCPAGWSCAWERCQWDEMLAAVNAARAEARSCGEQGAFAAAPPLELAPPLTEAAQQHATHMASTGCFSHDDTGPAPCDDGTPCTRIAAAGYRWSAVGENLSFGQRDATEAVLGWLASPPHCANLMEPGFVHFGSSVALDPDGIAYFAQCFGAPGSATANECR